MKAFPASVTPARTGYNLTVRWAYQMIGWLLSVALLTGGYTQPHRFWVAGGVTGNTLWVDWSPDGAWIASLSNLSDVYPEILKIWDARTGVAVKTLSVLPFTGNRSQGQIAFSPNGMYLGVALPNNFLVFRVDGWRLERVLPVRCQVFCWLPDSQRVIIQEYASEARASLWRIDTGEHVRTYLIDGSRMLAVDPTATFVATVSSHGDLALYRLSNGWRAWQFSGSASAAAFLPNNQVLLVAGLGLHLVSLSNGAILQTLSQNRYGGLALSRNGRWSIVWFQSDTRPVMELWDLQTLRLHSSVAPPQPSASFYTAIAFSPDDRYFVTAGYYRQDWEGERRRAMLMWETATLTRLPEWFDGHQDTIRALRAVGSTRQIISLDAAGEIRWWDIDTGRLRRRVSMRENIFCAEIDPLGELAALGKGLNIADTVVMYNLATLQEQAVLRMNVLAGVGRMAFSANRSYLAIGGLAETRILDTQNFGSVARLGSANQVRFAPAAPYLWLLGSSQTVLRAYQIGSWQLTTQIRLDDSRIYSIALSRNGRWLATGTYEGLLYLWQLPSGHLQAFAGVLGGLVALEFDPTSRVLVGSTSNGALCFWRVPNLELLAIYPEAFIPFAAHLLFDWSGRMLLAGQQDGTVTALRNPYPPHPADVTLDGCVDDADVLAVLFAIGQTGEHLPEDVNRDGNVDDYDLIIVLTSFGHGCE